MGDFFNQSMCVDGIHTTGYVFENLVSNYSYHLTGEELIRITSEPLGFAPFWWKDVVYERRILHIFEISKQRNMLT